MKRIPMTESSDGSDEEDERAKGRTDKGIDWIGMKPLRLSLSLSISRFSMEVDAAAPCRWTSLYSIVFTAYHGSMSIECVAVVGRRNNPLFLSTYPRDDTLDLQHRFQLIIYSSLDVIDSFVKQKLNGDAETGTDSQFLGYLCSVEHFKIFGYITNTSIKFLLVVNDELDSLRLPFTPVHHFFARMHRYYVECIYCPFYQLETPITSKRFSKNMNVLVTDAERQWFA
jgi:hypothetical protein